ncbi:penicillin-binding protein 1C [Longibacter salinarum]|uniref:peptidoglycan glycosyltransferase n=1 Tax=Longibacter salinarum TaxID=1850348 RepID=A0A2A8D028_9BACT|nr:penicillin-binding protein 1C [Longibacter salinarum]PEN14244.1 penicillin-binding protein 1C [Longibacter salinarum]
MRIDPAAISRHLRRGLVRLRAVARRRPYGVVAACLLIFLLLSLAWPLPETADPQTNVVSLHVTDRSGLLLREIRPAGRGRPVPLEAVDPSVRAALIATEDQRFYRHPGIDPVAVARAIWSNLSQGRIVSGASTLTMQVARRIRNASHRGWWDKLAEAHLALRIDLRWSKDRVLAAWLNRVSYGNRAHGIEAAAQLYFGKSAIDLTLAESALLVGLPQSPTRYNPFRHLDRARERQRQVLRAMASAGDLSSAEADRLATLPLDLNEPRHIFRAPHFTEWLRVTRGLDDPNRARTGPGHSQPVEVRTTLDARLQHTVVQLVRSHVRRLDNEKVTNGAAVVIENRTGAIRAYVGSADFWNAEIGGQNDGVRMRRQPGSALKPFTYARALDARLHTAASVLPDIELNVPEAGGAFTPTNYDGTLHGPTPLREALANSYNIPAVRVAQELGAGDVLATMKDVGLTSLDRSPEHYGVGLTLGNGEVRMLHLARAYAGLARGGMLPGLRSVYWTRTAQEDTLYVSPRTEKAMDLSPGAVRIITDILADPFARAEAFGRHGPLEFPFPVAAKTGTSKDYRDNWTAGFTPTHTVVVWVGNFDGSPMRRVSGVTGAGPLFHAIMSHLGPGGAFRDPTRAGLQSVDVCPASGNRPGAHCPSPRSEWFLPGTAPAATDTCTVHRRIPIDRRSGLLASDDTPADAVDQRLFTVYPEKYHAWMRDNDVPLPPRVTHAEARRNDDERAWQKTNRLQIHYPLPGMNFHVNPVLHDQFQQIHLQGTAPTTWHDVHWVVDGERLSVDYQTAQWRLSPGRHTLHLRAIGPDGTRYRSRSAPIVVHDMPKTAGWSR